ncbi:Natural resistance-associated macrophage protein 1 (NRAMP 1) (Solute carrier family 11 member 1) [Durusdinium trenchii]|uniref:Natural resistance-associated macrophage protein 1 (NRAMP 1) (Solute carrier family 11 member 1) n=1 Tax=Durusdinium trenchii TaxID=1381693 RepID=A0ABP0LRJ6_9DINO
MLILPACGTTQGSTAADSGDNQYREAIDVFTSPASDEGMDPIAAAAFWGTRYNTNQSDPNVAVKFSSALRKIGSTDEAVGVMQKASGSFPDNADVSLEYGKVLVNAGRAFEAVRHLENATAQKPGDWRALSAYGVALDQIGEHESARKKYNEALMIAPGAVTVINNKGLSYAMAGDLTMARKNLREASGRAGSDARIRQNLALVMALSGEMREAERLARSDLPPQVADNNIDFFRQLMNQPAYWGEYAASNVDVPDFDDALSMLKRFRSIGPGALTAAAFIGPGTVTTATVAGATYGYALVWALVFATIAAIILQETAARLGVAGRLGLGEAIKHAVSDTPFLKWGAISLIIAALFIGNAAYEGGNIAGAVLGLEAAFSDNAPRAVYTGVIIAIAGAVLLFGGYRTIERVLIGAVLIMTVAFTIALFAVGPDWGALAKGALAPTIPASALPVVIGLIGTTIVPYNLFFARRCGQKTLA